jgi:formate dehydrogenase beta subunit
MTGIVFSSWQGEVIDNRGKAEEEAALPKRLTIPDEFQKGEKIRAFMGWDGFAVMDPNIDVVHMAAKYVEAVQNESCGRCIPCRVGTKIILDVMNRICEGKGSKGDLDQILTLAVKIKEGSKCQIGQTGLGPLLEAIKHYRYDFDKAVEQGLTVRGSGYRVSVTAPCMSACPTKLKIPQYIEQIAEGLPGKALSTIREGTCMAGTLGRVCVRPCESNCRRANIDESLSIKSLKRFAADYELEKGKRPHIEAGPTKSGKKVAVLGAGPAGLSCAYYLAQMGHGVTLYERLGEPGGMAAVGIPDYRLPRDILGGEADLVGDLGVEIKYNTVVGKDVSFSDILGQFDAVFIGVGAHNSSPSGMGGEDQGYQGFITGVKYLLDINMGKDPYPEGKKVVVFGGGNVAMDCVRSSFRVGKSDVNLVYRRTKAEMPADPVEVHDAEEEGVNFHYLCNPTKVIAKDGKVVALELIRMELGEPDKSGRRRPVPVPGSEFVIETDIVVPAIGQAVNLSFLNEEDGIQLTKWNTLLVDQDTFQTSQPKVFSAGDCETGPDVLVRACGNGKRAAWRIDQFLRGEKPVSLEKEKFNDLFSKVKVYQKDEDIGIAGGELRLPLRMLDPKVRKLTFEEVEEGYRVDEAVKEAMRCLRCYRIGMVAV